MLNADRLRRLLAAQLVCQRVSAAALIEAVHQQSEMEAEHQRFITSASGSNAAVPPDVVLALCNLRQRSLQLKTQLRLVGEKSEVATLQARLVRQIERLIEARIADEQKARAELQTEEVLDQSPWRAHCEDRASLKR